MEMINFEKWVSLKQTVDGPSDLPTLGKRQNGKFRGDDKTPAILRTSQKGDRRLFESQKKIFVKKKNKEEVMIIGIGKDSINN